jgi:hypothetical protein
MVGPGVNEQLMSECTRRDFLKTAGWITAALAVPGAPALALQRRQSFPPLAPGGQPKKVVIAGAGLDGDDG